MIYDYTKKGCYYYLDYLDYYYFAREAKVASPWPAKTHGDIVLSWRMLSKILATTTTKNCLGVSQGRKWETAS